MRVGQALEDRVVLAVDRHDGGVRRTHRLHQQFAGEHQRFLVGEQQALARVRGGERGGQARRADDRGDDGRAGIAGDERIERIAARVRLRRQARIAQAIAQGVETRRIGDHRMVGTMRAAQREQCIDLRTRGQHARAHPPWMPRNDVERTGPDGSGGSEDCYVLHGQKPNRPLPSAKTGSAASTLSMRSRIPPWPGMRSPESFAPTCRLSRLSNRSPTTEKPTVTTTTSTTAGNWATDAPASGAPTSATMIEATMPPTRPSMVLLGLMRGLSLCLPKWRPAKYAPLSAAQITTSASSSQRWPLGWLPWMSASAHQAGITASVPAASLNMRACVSWSEANS